MKKIYLTVFIMFYCIFSDVKAQSLWDINVMKNIKENLHTTEYHDAYMNLLKEADDILGQKTYSVVYKEYNAPSGNNHDYVSLSRYAWPDPEKPNGLPYKLRDGLSNPELEKYDRIPLGEMANAVNTLALAYFYNTDERYASKAVDFLCTWFLDEDTKMNPNLNYAQFIPGTNDWKGRAAGLIDTYSFVEMLSSIGLLKGSPNYTNDIDAGLKNWFREFSVWWQTSGQGISENNSKNNHGLAYDIQLVTYLLFSGDKSGAEDLINKFPQKRLFPQIEPDGSQPQELRRTLAFHYSEYNIRHMIDMFAIAKEIGLDIYQNESADGRSFFKALNFLTPYLGKDVSDWPYQQISGWENAQQNFCEDLYRIVALDKSRTDYLKLYKKYTRQDKSARNRLLYGSAGTF